MNKYEGIKEANEELNKISSDEQERRRAQMRDEAIRNTASYFENGYNKGKKETTQEIVKSMKKEKVDIEIIMKVTGLSKEEIEKI